jgi:PPOX class probable F420-dependent enzyme
VSRRTEIRMSEEEIAAFLAEQKTMICATLGPNGRPHLMPLWYTIDGRELCGWTYAKSQKAKNLERDPHATLEIEDGIEYHELKGVMIECDVQLDRDAEGYGLALVERYAGDSPDAKEAFREQAKKRVGLRFTPTRVVSWDHSKLGGTY